MQTFRFSFQLVLKLSTNCTPITNPKMVPAACCLIWSCILIVSVVGDLSNSDCNALTYSNVPSCISDCTRSCSFGFTTLDSGYSDSCACENGYCAPKLEEDDSDCSSIDKKIYTQYLTSCDVGNTLSTRCMDCLNLGCDFCDRRDSVVNGRPKQNSTSFCFSPSLPQAVDPFFGKCDAVYYDSILSVRETDNDVSGRKDDKAISEECDIHTQIPIGVVILYLIIYTLCPLFVCGAFWYAICFGVPRAMRKACYCGHSVAVFADDDTGRLNERNNYYGRFDGDSNTRRLHGGQMYVMPNDTVPAVVSRGAIQPTIQTAVVVNGDIEMSNNGRSAFRDEMSTGSFTVVQDQEPDDGIPIAYAQPL